MPDIYRTRFAGKQPPEGIAVHCSDPRYQRHFQEFLDSHLGLENYGLIAVPGGPQFLTLLEYLPKFAWVGWRWLTFLVGVAQPRRAILIAHDECLWYRDGRFWQHRGDIHERQLKDLRQVRAEILQRFPGVSVELYFARFEGEQAVFEALS